MLIEAERRTFSIDNAIIFQHIFGSQRTDTCGAFCELIQNSFDSNSTMVDLTISEEGFSLIDNGDGFKDKESIYKWFEVFGAEKNDVNSRVFSQFRMGRGQIMGICSTTWHTHKFMMFVDVKNKGLDYDLTDSVSNFEGCHISGKWYEPVTEHYYSYGNEKTTEAAIEFLVSKISKHCRYIFGMEIYINGLKINKEAKDYRWDVDAEDHYFLKASTLLAGYRSGEVKVYNLGMYVQTLHDMPSTGYLISKSKLQINVTRNSVQSDCPVYKNMLRSLVVCKPKLHPNVKYTTERASTVLSEFMRGIYSLEEIAHLKLFSDIHRSRHKSLIELSQINFTISDYADSKGADRIDQAGRVFVVHSDVFWFNCQHYQDENSIQRNMSLAFDLFKKVAEFSEELSDDLLSFVIPFEHCVNEVSGENIVLGPAELSKSERRFLEVLTLVKRRYRGNLKGILYRDFVIGSSVQFDAWTDSENFICLHKKLANKLNYGMDGALEIASIIIHECCHINDSGTHDHNFYRNFHNIIIDKHSLFYIAKLLLVAFDDVLFENNIKGSAKLIKSAGIFRKNGIALCAGTKPKLLENGKQRAPRMLVLDM